MTETSDVTVGPRPAGWAETWKSPAGFSAYEASDDSTWELGDDGKLIQVSGGIRSIDRTVKGRFYRGTLLKAHPVSNSGGYAAFNPVDDEGVKHPGMLVHRFILLAFAGPCPDGMETRHLVNNPLDCRWAPGATAEEVLANGGNIIRGKPSDQPEDQFRNGSRQRAAPKPDKRCVICAVLFTTPGQRCHACVVGLGQQAAELYWLGMKPEKAAERLDYPSAVGLVTLAVKYGGYGRPPLIWRLRRKFTRRNRHGASQSARPDCPNGGDSA